MPLAGCRVVELGDHISAPYATRLLADLGADVIKVEPPRGDSSRRHGPFPGGSRDPEQSGLFHALNFNKRGIVLDLDSDDDRNRLERLLEGSHAFLSNLPAAHRRSLELDLEGLEARQPQLTAVAVTPLGDEGPDADLPGCSLSCSAFAGASWVIGHPDRQPLTLPVDLADYEGGANAAAAALVGMFSVMRGGPGQGIDIAIVDILTAFTGINARMYVPYGKPWARAGRRASGSGGSYPYTILPCRDGYVAVIGRGQRDWDNILAAMGSPSWAEEERFRDPYVIARKSSSEADVHLTTWFAGQTRDALLSLAREHGFALAPVRTIAEILQEPQFRHRHLFVDPLDVGGRSFTPAGLPFSFSDLDSPGRVSPAPRLGEHSAEILGALEGSATPAQSSGVDS